VTSGCIFCAIVADEAPRSVVHEDAIVLAFMDIAPITPGHVLVVPKTHATGLTDLPETTGGHMFGVAQRIAAALRATADVRVEGVNLFLADGAVAGQEVFHAHLHVLPRFAGDGLEITWARRPSPARGALDAQASQIAAALPGTS
jgi:histidine triad (HIT) family protein